MKYKFLDLVDKAKLEELINLFYKATGIVVTILDHKGNVFVASEWRNICTHFHRANRQSTKKCVESDTLYCKLSIEEGEKHKIYQCGNGLIDALAPIIIGEEHVATIFTGQLLLGEPNLDFFRKQAKKYHYDESTYMKVLTEVPIIDKDQLKHVMNFLCSFANVLGEMGLKELEHLKAQNEILAAKQELEASQNILIGAFEKLKDQYS